ncbi:MAG: restriction endonuclease subunit S, partial [Campylobacter hyointestinalis]
KIYENHLTIDMFCNCFYRDYKFLCDDNILVLFSKNTFSNKALLFISSIINKHKIRFSFAKQFRQKDFNELKIYLPIATNGKIDFDFMENFIDKIEQKQREILEFYKQRKKDIGGYELNSRIWQEFKIGDLFLVKNNPQLNKSSFNFSKNGEYPYFTRTVFNNGILSYVDYLDEEHKIKGNSIAVGMIAMKFFYMKQDFYAGQFTKTIYPKFDNFNDKIAKYFISIFNKNSPLYLKNFVVKDFEKDFTNTTIKLPITKNGEIDFDFMENFIKAISKECIKGVDSYLVKNIVLQKK